jgi:hypothetical protein
LIKDHAFSISQAKELVAHSFISQSEGTKLKSKNSKASKRQKLSEKKSRTPSEEGIDKISETFDMKMEIVD